ncbi:hypothetical protein ACJMK2_033689 [Sinanodonta woodiana]|uniref:Annexin n=2 Tax=Sinanodonta woodiana TaxID=1069815 RepID=A0ABD3WPQ8_SINWO
MPKHHPHGYQKRSSSSSSSSSSDDEFKHLPKHERKRLKKLKKQMKKGLIPPGSVPGLYPGGHGQHYPGSHGNYPTGSYPAGGYPMGSAPPPQPGYPAPAGYHPPPPGGMYPGQPMGQYPQPPQPAYPAGGYPGGMPPPAGGYPGHPGAPPGYPGSSSTISYPGQEQSAPAGTYPGQQPPPSGSYPGQQPPPSGSYPEQHAPPVGIPQPGIDIGFVAPAPGGNVSTAGGFVAPAPGGNVGTAGGFVAPTPGVVPGHTPTHGGYPDPNLQPLPIPQSQPSPVPPPQGAGYGPTPVMHGQPGAPGVMGATEQLKKMNLQAPGEVMRPTIRPAQPFSAEEDAKVLRTAMKGIGTDEQTIINLITKRSNQQRQQIKTMFKTLYGKDLIKDMESELSGDFKESIMALFQPTTYYDAWSLQNAMMGLGTKEAVLFEILCTRTNAEIKEIVSCYKTHFGRDLERDITSDTSGHFKRLLVSCCQGNRTELTPEQLQRMMYEGVECVIDRNLARQEAQALFQAGEKKIGTDESVFLQIMAIRHHYQLRATFEEYVKIAGRDILSTIDREMSGDLREGFRALVMSALNRPEYFADVLYDSMKGAGTRDSTLIRVIVSRSEIDLQNIKEVFLTKYHKTLATMISDDTSGDFCKLLLAMIGQ